MLKNTDLSNLIEASEQLVQSFNQIGGRQLFRQRSEVYDVCVQDAGVIKKKKKFFFKEQIST